MSPWHRFLTNTFLRAPAELLTALVRLILFVLLFFLILFLKFCEWLKWLFRTKTLFEEETEEECGRLPEALVRRPDPCIYSQTYLRSQDMPVTWNNPDIWVALQADPTAIEPDSYHLIDDTDYIASVQVHNASTDPAIGVKVRLFYRPWSFNSPELVPVESDGGGNEVFHFVNIAPMGSAIAKFNWHTPSIGPGEQKHFCLQAHVSHPLDINTANNIGQENTNVYSQNPGHVAPGELALVDIPLFNNARRAVEVRFLWDSYEIDKGDKVRLDLEVNCGRPRLPLSQRLAHGLPVLSPAAPRFTTSRDDGSVRREGLVGKLRFSTPKSGFRTAKTRYRGFAPFKKMVLSRDYNLPPGMEVGHNLDPGELQLPPDAQRETQVSIKIPDDAADGELIRVNVVAEADDGTLLGGVTMLFEVQA